MAWTHPRIEIIEATKLSFRPCCFWRHDDNSEDSIEWVGVTALLRTWLSHVHS